ncbi:MAG: type II toxin-antitoxin system Phd/YefM family antitoxin [Pseudomonadota bacterium]
MLQATSTEFTKNFGHYSTVAQREPVAVTNHGRVTGYFMSAPEYEEYDRVKNKMRRVYTSKTMPEHIIDALRVTRVDPKHDHLNNLLDDGGE